MSSSVTFFVPGDPQPFPKKRTNKKTGMIYSHDPSGKKKAWTEAVRLAAIAAKPKLIRKPGAVKSGPPSMSASLRATKTRCRRPDQTWITTCMYCTMRCKGSATRTTAR